MNLDADDEILQDFLVEATEILDQLGEQLVDLERRPEDSDLLNEIFRGFHTVKGGAGFLGINNLVELCHKAEDVFNVLRQGQRKVTPELMDAILQTLDSVNGIMVAVNEGLESESADRALIARLEALAQPGAGDELAPPTTDEGVAELSAQTPSESPPAASIRPRNIASGGDEITEDEFEALLDELHGAGKHSGAPNVASQLLPADSEHISEDEFESLLDELHGSGKHTGTPIVASSRQQGSAGSASDSIAPTVATSSAEVSARAEPVLAAPIKETASPRNATMGHMGQAAGAPAQRLAHGETTVRVDTQRLDDIMNLVGELVLVRNRLSTLKTSMANEALANAVSNLDVVTADLQLAVMKTRMQPVKKIFGRFPRVVRDLARNLNKDVELEMHGEDTDLDKNLVEALADPMVHLVRNAVDHGIEPPDVRATAGKPRRGKVVLSAAQEGDHILLSIEDDGKGMDPDVLRKSAVEKCLMDTEAAARLDDRECYNLIFHPGFSTKAVISDVSGRGVGMDVVKTKIAQMNGSVEIDSKQGRGSKIAIKLPLTLAILPTLMVVLGEQPFALPLASVVEIFNLDLRRTNTVDGQLTIRMRERALPLFYLSRWLVLDQSFSPDYSDGSGHVVVINAGGLHVGLVVDFLVGQEEVVIKPLGAMLQGLDGMAGATITGDGKIALILDVPGLMRKYARRY